MCEKIPNTRKIGISDNFPDTVYSGHRDCKDRYLISSDKEPGRKLKKTDKTDFSLRAQSYLRHEHH